MSFYRIQDADRDVAELLDPAKQWSEEWGTYDVRHGVSVMWNVDLLAEYFAKRNTSAGGDMYDAEFLSTLVLVELDGDPSDEEDHDAAEGAELILPTRIINVGPIPADMVDTICGA